MRSGARGCAQWGLLLSFAWPADAIRLDSDSVSNRSSLNVAAIAEASRYPERRHQAEKLSGVVALGEEQWVKSPVSQQRSLGEVAREMFQAAGVGADKRSLDVQDSELKDDLDMGAGKTLMSSMSTQDIYRFGKTPVASLKQVFTLFMAMYGSIAIFWLTWVRLPLRSIMRRPIYIWLLCITWSSMSIGMQVLNKTLVMRLRSPAVISVVQMWMAVILVGLPSYKSFWDVSHPALCMWMVVPFIFAAMLCTSFYTYEYISLSLYTVIRNLTPLVVLPVERALMPAEQRPQISWSVVLSIGFMLLGAVLYAGGLKEYSSLGVVFGIINMILAVCDRLIQRRLLTAECKGLPSAVCTVINNMFGSIPALMLASTTHQLQDLQSAARREEWTDPRCLSLLLLSGLVGIGICYLGFECQRAISATSFFVLQNMSKVAVVLCGVAFFADPLDSACAVIGLALSLGGSFSYGRAQMLLSMERSRQLAKDPLARNTRL